MDAVIGILALLTLAGAIGSFLLRQPVHCALSLALSLIGVAGFYLRLGAQFLGLAQVLVYVGAVAVLIVFAILLTQGSEKSDQRLFHRGWPVGVGVAILLFGCLAAAVLRTEFGPAPAGGVAVLEIRDMGVALMTRYIVPLEVLGVLLTAAVIGAVIVAGPDRRSAAPGSTTPSETS